jgi:UDP-N-acetylmuramoylalanine--D-glutamate ligase
VKTWAEQSWKARKVTVAGLGSFGGQVAAAKFFARLGADITVTDLKEAGSLESGIAELEGCDVRFVLGEHREEDFTGADLVVASPAIREDSPFLLAAAGAGVDITHETDLFFMLCKAPIIGVTGSNGKSTTAALLAHILEKCPAQAEPPRRKIWLGGNIGRPLLLETDTIDPADLVVMELSSFQLDDLGELDLSPHGAVVTNLSPNHLDRHGTFENYARAKRNITAYQEEDDFLVLNADDPNLSDWRRTHARVTFFGKNGREALKGVFVSEGSFVSITEAGRERASLPGAWQLKGKHNLVNLAAAAQAAAQLGVTLAEALAAAADFRPLPHRLEFVGAVNGVCFYNDSIATTPESAGAALESFTEPVVLIAGGYDKGADLSDFASEAARKAKALVLLGATAPRIEAAAREAKAGAVVVRSADLSEAVNEARALAQAGDVVLLSPACASYDMFENFRHRGDVFRQEVGKLQAKEGDGNS